jgi:rod shape-determining protein MreC
MRHRTALLLLVAFLVPFVAGPGQGADPFVAGGILSLVPAAAGDLPAGGDGAGWREESHRLLLENADLRARLLAVGEVAGLRARDTVWWEDNPLRVEARVIGRDASPFRGSLLISAGSREGIGPGAPVVVGEALLGVVSSAGTRSSCVRLVTDPGHRIWTMVLSAGVESNGYVEGTGRGEVRMHLLPTEAAVVPDPVFTAGGDGVLPRGLLIGRIRRAGDLDRDGVAEVEVTPAVDATRVGFVNILVSD